MSVLCTRYTITYTHAHLAGWPGGVLRENSLNSSTGETGAGGCYMYFVFDSRIVFWFLEDLWRCKRGGSCKTVNVLDVYLW